jgi:hypothetical protein
MAMAGEGRFTALGDDASQTDVTFDMGGKNMTMKQKAKRIGDRTKQAGDPTAHVEPWAGVIPPGQYAPCTAPGVDSRSDPCGLLAPTDGNSPRTKHSPPRSRSAASGDQATRLH